MSTVASVRKALRALPAFQALDTRTLDKISRRLDQKRYATRTHLWFPEEERRDLWLIVQSGEIDVRGFDDGRATYDSTLKAGDTLDLAELRKRRHLRDVCLVIKPHTTLYTLNETSYRRLKALADGDQKTSAPGLAKERPGPWAWVGIALVLLALSLFWTDLSRLAAGGLYLGADQLYRRGHRSAALTLLNYATLVDPNAYYAYAREGYIQYTSGQPEKAAERFRQSLHVYDGDGPTLNNLAVVSFERASDASTLALQHQAVDAAPNAAVARYNLGWMWLSHGAYEQAERAFREATRIDPAWSLPQIYLSYAYLKQGDLARATEVAERALELDPAQPVTSLILAVSLYRQQKVEAALETLTPVIAAYPDAVLPRLYRALSLRDLGRYPEALQAFETLLASTSEAVLRERIELEIERIHLMGSEDQGVSEEYPSSVQNQH